MATYTQAPNTTLSEDAKTVYEKIAAAELSVLCGPNNSGKSFALKKLAIEFGDGAFYVGPARFFNFNVLGQTDATDTSLVGRKVREIKNLIGRGETNIDDYPVPLQETIANLSNKERKTLFKLTKKLLGSRPSIAHINPKNRMSPQYLTVDGHNLSYSSSGFRLIMTLLGALVNADLKRILIDEPELGVSPQTQGAFADFIFGPDQREKYFPHIDTIIIATHSPIFLDRNIVTNNYFVSMDGAEIDIWQSESVQDLTRMQYFLLGNRFETMHLPTAIVMVEGKSDFPYVDAVITKRFPESSISVINCGNDIGIKQNLHLARQWFTDLTRSPYHGRIFTVLDSVHGAGIRDSILKFGVPEANCVVWDNNGIEYYYPKRIIDDIFGSDSEIAVDNEKISANGIEMTKVDLSYEVTKRLREDEKYPEELETKLLTPLNDLVY